VQLSSCREGLRNRDRAKLLSSALTARAGGCTRSRERMPLEQARPADAAEVLLCTTSGRLQEGLVSNLFVVMCDGGAQVHAPSGTHAERERDRERTW
jgi:branched-subunit amino acid aminotransferase/4-amino-4-deoxychorismate lyase